MCVRNFSYGCSDIQSTEWSLSSTGSCSNININDYCPSFEDGAKITVHLNMTTRACAFTVNGIKYPEVRAWDNIPSKVHPVVSLCYPGRVRIQPHQR